jgi:hypothetical protein
LADRQNVGDTSGTESGVWLFSRIFGAQIKDQVGLVLLKSDEEKAKKLPVGVKMSRWWWRTICAVADMNKIKSETRGSSRFSEDL